MPTSHRAEALLTLLKTGEGFAADADNTAVPGARGRWMDHGGAGWCERAIRDAVLSGDAAAWRTWYAEYFDRLARYARWRCGGLADLADDVTQEAWLTAVRRLRSFDPDRGSFFDWLCGIAANAARSALRARRRHAKRA